MKRRNSAVTATLVAAAFLLLGLVFGSGSFSRQIPPKPGQTKVVFFNVGDADSILILDGSGQNMLIDAGDNAHEDFLVDSIREFGVSRIDILVLTHPHEDHIGGADAVIGSFDIETIYMPQVEKDSASFRDLLQAADDKNLLFMAAKSGMSFQLGENEFTILNPDENAQYSDMNDYSVVLSAQICGKHFYFMGDATDRIEAQLLERGEVSACDVLKVGHHGSATSSSEEFLKTAAPAYAVVSCDSGGPSSKTENRLHVIGSKIYVTGIDGTVILTLSEDGIVVETEHE